MSRRLNEEQEKYTELYRDLQEISKQKEDEIAQSDMIAGEKLTAKYRNEVSFSGMKSFFNEWEADTPEEIETLEICKYVRNI